MLERLLANTLRPAGFKPLPASPYANSCSNVTLETTARIGLLTSSGLRAAYERQQLAQLTASWLPTSPQPVLQIVTDLGTWVATFDDRAERKACGAEAKLMDKAYQSVFMSDLTKLFINPQALPNSTDPHVLYAADICSQLAKWPCNGQLALKRLYPIFMNNVTRNVTAASMDETATILSFEDYIGYRCDDVLIRLVIPLLQTLAQPQPLTDAQILHPDIQRLEDLTIMLCVCFNDLASYPKESTASQHPFNMVEVLRQQESLGVLEAMNRAVEFANTYYLEFVRLADMYQRSEPTATHTDNLRRVFLGLLDWSFTSARYKVAAGAVPLAAAMAPELLIR